MRKYQFFATKVHANIEERENGNIVWHMSEVLSKVWLSESDFLSEVWNNKLELEYLLVEKNAVKVYSFTSLGFSGPPVYGMTLNMDTGAERSFEAETEEKLVQQVIDWINGQ